jgi:hypothetical protein
MASRRNHSAFGSVSDIGNRCGHSLVTIAVSPRGGEVHGPNRRDPVARQHRQREIFRSCATKGHAPKFTRRKSQLKGMLLLDWCVPATR